MSSGPSDQTPTATEVAVLGRTLASDVKPWLDRVLQTAVGCGLSRIVWRAGRIDAVYAVELTDSRQVLLKVHRPPGDLAARRVCQQAQAVLAERGFPCATPLAEPVVVDDRIVTVETVLDPGHPGEAHAPQVRRSIATGLAEQIQVLSAVPGLATSVGVPPAWCVYRGGAWPVPHDPIFDFRVTPSGWEWLDDTADEASRLIVAGRRSDDELVAAHADWYCGNLGVDAGRVVACFDWDLVADTVAVVVGLTAGFFANGSEPGPPYASPEETVAFLTDVESTLGMTFSVREQEVAAAAVVWSQSYTARCELSMLDGSPEHDSVLDNLHRNRTTYLALRW